MEYCSAGSLDEIMYRTNKPLEEVYIQHVIKEVLKALIYLNEVCYVIHRDVKSGNILLNKEGDVKLSDFGVSSINYSLRQKKSTFAGSPYWISPDMVDAEKEEKPYNYKIDIWSLGITCIELAEIQPPLSNLEPDDVFEFILNNQAPSLTCKDDFSPEFSNFIEKCLNKNAHLRSTPHDLYQV